MPIYEISWAWEEGEMHDILEHEKTFSQKQLKEMLRVAFCKAIDELLAASEYKGFWIGLEDAFYSSYALDFSVAGIMCKEFGFKQVEMTCASEEGGLIIEGDCEEDEQIGQWLGPDRYKAVLEHNAQVQRKGLGLEE